MSWKERIKFILRKNEEVTEIHDEVNADKVETEHQVHNLLDGIIVKHGNTPTTQEIYQSRWVWYHSILAAEILFTNILLIAILCVLAFK